MRLKITIGFTIVVAALFVIALMFEGAPTTTTRLKNNVKVSVPNRIDNIATVSYSGLSPDYTFPNNTFQMFMLRSEE